MSLSADFKILGGLNLSWFNDESLEWTPKTGLVGGIGIEFDLSYRTLLEVDLLFFQKGGIEKNPETGNKHILNVGSVPVLIRSKFWQGTSPYLAAGMEISSIISYTSKPNDGDAQSYEESIHRLDYGLVAGAGIEFKLQEELFFFVEARYHCGLRNLLILPLDGQERRTASVVLLIGVRS